jgi:chromosome segregation ATPase
VPEKTQLTGLKTMAAIAATSYATPSAQPWQGQARLEQARRQADQAEANAKQLRDQANQAEQEAQKGQQNVRSVSAQVAQQAQADSTYGAQLRQQAVAGQSRQLQRILGAATAPATPSSPPPNPVKAGSTAWTEAAQPPSSGRLLNLLV